MMATESSPPGLVAGSGGQCVGVREPCQAPGQRPAQSYQAHRGGDHHGQCAARMDQRIAPETETDVPAEQGVRCSEQPARQVDVDPAGGVQCGQQEHGAEEGPRLQAQQAGELLPEQRQREHDGEVAPMHGAQPGRGGRVGAADVRPETAPPVRLRRLPAVRASTA